MEFMQGSCQDELTLQELPFWPSHSRGYSVKQVVYPLVGSCSKRLIYDELRNRKIQYCPGIRVKHYILGIYWRACAWLRFLENVERTLDQTMIWRHFQSPWEAQMLLYL